MRRKPDSPRRAQGSNADARHLVLRARERVSAFLLPLDLGLGATDGRGVDVVLNSLSGRALTQGIRCLAPFGRFVEIGKTDIYANRQLGLEPFGLNRSYHCLDINRWSKAFPKSTGETLPRLLGQVADQTVRAPSIGTFELEACGQALAALARGSHRGKIVVEVPRDGSLMAERGTEARTRSDRSYLITGGCGGFGLAVAERLAARGAGTLVLVSRRGALDDDGREAKRRMETSGATVHVLSCDVGDEHDVGRLWQRLNEFPPLAGIVHCAMVLDDGALSTLDAERIERVMHPKAEGGWWLHQYSRNQVLDFFICFSSIASVLGTPGQATYAAANSFLDGLAHHRSALGLPATSINWGVLLGTGVVERADAEQRRKILAQGVAGFSVAQALDILERIITQKPTQLMVADVDWQRVASLEYESERRSRFGDLIEKNDVGAEQGGARERILALPPDEQVHAIADLLLAEVAKVSGEDRSRLDASTSLSRFGLDSLMGTQLAVLVESYFGVELPLIKLLRGPTAEELAHEILRAMPIHEAHTDQHRGRDEAPSNATTAWVRRLHSSADAPRARLFVVPPMASDGSVYEGWLAALPAEVDLCVIERPDLGGEGDALLRGPITALTQALVEALLPWTDLPFALYGHSMGGWIALDLAHALDVRKGLRPLLIGVGAMPSAAMMTSCMPQGADRPEAISDAHLEEVAARFKLPTAWLNHGSNLQRLRRDIWLGVQSRHFADDAAVRVPSAPVVLFAGKQDPISTVDGERDPRIDGVAPQEIIEVQGAHDFAMTPVGQYAVIERLVAALPHSKEGRDKWTASV